MDKEQDNGIEFTAPGGFGAKLKGSAWSAKEVVLIIAILMSTVFLSWERVQSNSTFLSQHQITQKMVADVMTNQSALVREVALVSKEVRVGNEVQTYVLALSQSEREKLKLTMPESLRSRSAIPRGDK